MKQKIKLDWLAFFRISVGIFALFSLLAFWKDIPKILFDGAYLKPELLDVLADGYSPTIYSIFVFLQKYNPALNFDMTVSVILYLYIIGLISLIFGFFTRASAGLSLLLQIVIYKSMHLYLYGSDFFLTMTLFYCLIFPKSNFSLDFRIFKFKQNISSLRWSLLLLQGHVCVIYFFSGLDKSIGITWWNGEAIWKAVTSHDYNGLYSLYRMKIPNIVLIIAGISTVAIELLYPIFINIKSTRKFWLSLTVMMHVSISIFMGLHFFAMIMIILNMSAFYFPYVDEELEESQEHKTSARHILGKN